MCAFRFLACFAHPDDESFTVGGIVALNRQRGIHSTLVCATRGEAGEISDPALATPATLGMVREAELAAAADHMGLNETILLGYRDSGMDGTAENDHPAAFMRASPSGVVERLTGLLRRYRPHVVVTFDPTGGYGHPDHIAIHHHTVAAFHAAADATVSPHLGPAWQAQRLFYTATDPTIFTRLRAQLIAQGEPLPGWANDDNGPVWPDQPVHARVDAREFVDAKWAALFSHRTQFGERHPFRVVPESLVRELIAVECFELAWPMRTPDQPWTDLFMGLTPED